MLNKMLVSQVENPNSFTTRVGVLDPDFTGPNGEKYFEFQGQWLVVSYDDIGVPASMRLLPRSGIDN